MSTNKINQTDMFSLFGIEDEYTEKKKREEEERMKQQAEIAKRMEANKDKTSTASSSKPAADEFEVNVETTIYFYTETISITDYFSIEELSQGIEKKNKDSGETEYRKIKETDLKSRLKKDYPVLDTGAQMVYIKKKNVVSIILKAKKKGLDTEENSKESITDSFASSKRIPFSILREFIAISKHFSDEHGTEVHADIYYNVESETFYMELPKQTANMVNVEVTEDSVELALKTLGKPIIKCMEIHSHHTMAPNPSYRDDLSERAPILYAIVGRINNFFPEITVRTFDVKSEIHIPLDPWRIFENPFSSVPAIYDLGMVEVIS